MEPHLGPESGPESGTELGTEFGPNLTPKYVQDFVQTDVRDPTNQTPKFRSTFCKPRFRCRRPPQKFGPPNSVPIRSLIRSKFGPEFGPEFGSHFGSHKIGSTKFGPDSVPNSVPRFCWLKPSRLPWPSLHGARLDRGSGGTSGLRFSVRLSW